MKDKTEKEDDTVKFDLNSKLSTVNRYLLEGFKEFIKDEKITTERQFDKLYTNYKELR